MKKWKDIIVTVLIIVMVAGVIIGGIFLKRSVSEFWTNGVRTLGDYIHLDMQSNCYFVSEGKITGESIFTVSGVVYPYSEKDGFGFSGHLEVDACPMPMKEHGGSFGAFFMKNTIRLSNQGVKFLHPECDMWYEVIFSKADPQIVVIRIFRDDGLQIAVCANSPEQALEHYNYYLDNMYTD